MVAVNLIYSANKRTIGRFPELLLRNAVVERAPSHEDRRAIMRRPTLSTFASVGFGPIRGVLNQSGLFDGSTLIVSGQEVWSLSRSSVKTLKSGLVAGDKLVRMSAGRDADLNEVCYIATGDHLYKVVGDTVTEEDFPDSKRPGCQDIEVHRGFVLGVQYDTQQVYFQVPGDTAWDALSFASAEYKDDKLVAIRTLGDMIFLLGAASTEVWTLTGQADPAIAPYGGLNWNYGCRARDAAVALGAALIWVDDKCLVRMSVGGEPQVISDSGLAEQIRQIDPSDLRAWWFALDGHAYYVLTLGADSTWVYDLSAEQWGPWDSKGQSYFRGHLGVDAGDTVYVADNITQSIWRLDPEGTMDFGEEVTWEFPAQLRVEEGGLDIGNLELQCSVGFGPRTGQGSNPLIGMKYSVDGGHVFSGWKYKSLNVTGKFIRLPKWGPLKPALAPHGHFYRFFVSDPTVARVSGARVNVP